MPKWRNGGMGRGAIFEPWLNRDMDAIEDIVLSHSKRGMDGLQGALPEGFCRRAARVVLQNRGTVLIGTGFPVGGWFETDGPLGSLALYQVLEGLGSVPVIVCPEAMAASLEPRCRVLGMPILGKEDSLIWAKETIQERQPVALVSVEYPGPAEDGRCYNMFGRDITDQVARFDLAFGLAACPTVAIGDGGNEVGMGNLQEQLRAMGVRPSVVPCDELIIATVSNWGAYGLIAAMGLLTGQDVFSGLDVQGILSFLVKQGFVDGITGQQELSEDGFPLAVGLSILERLHREIRAEQGART